MSKLGECMICLDPIEDEKQGMLTAAPSCNKDHDVCRDCLAKYFYNELEVRRPECTTIPCPRSGCPNLYRSADIIPRVLETVEAQHYWWRSVIQASVMDSMGFCPSANCQTSFELFSEENGAGEGYAECPECEQGICVVCGCIWHSDRTCHRTNLWRWPPSRASPKENQMQSQRARSVEARNLARQHNWTRCPNCQHMISRTTGCNTIRCRCGVEFCYRCGSFSTDDICSIRCERLSSAALDAARQPMFSYPDASKGNGSAMRK